ncbi:5-formyltetrahydrofolate cyclo-ligase [Shewanella sp. NIFS-20-20]|uniref:5-formyltetrahydrofolate cyclo-ligase n=1 Tax=Shewanella sp. NIFS-20-20 TaxID=2853806 RepID=UPI001C450319|nr:5-formyltetrahydrofolate cyclo-ligase [Shewanella sp. NIFS-20-20]MBV7317371.1 5-formyltetrahydrofolate cyclo-ligase [Shewanella sp. NIFS-20-20]
MDRPAVPNDQPECLLALRQSQRQQMRQSLKQARAAISPQQQRASAQQAAQLTLDLLKRLPIKHLALYHTLGSELDTQPLIQLLRQQRPDCHLYLPRLHPFCHGHLLFLEYRAQTEMSRNRFGIAEPKLDCRHVRPAGQLDAILTPLVAFDKHGQRMGMGGGYYDRTLAHSQAITIGFAHDVQQVATLPVEAWDQGLDYVVTPSQCYDFKTK